jgi:catechol 2,3-dioxygenase-like lactoylglutathione lyase family enzyme
MKIIGLDALVFGVDDVATCSRYLCDYGLKAVDVNAAGGRFEALDGTSIMLRKANDPGLPKPMEANTTLREIVYGVVDESTLGDIERELRRDREVIVLNDGAIRCQDDMGFALRFQRTERKPFFAEAERVNSPGAAPQRAPNELGLPTVRQITPRTLSHVVLFVPDSARAEAFYVERLKFRCTDRFTGIGPFLRPVSTREHHSLFMIQTPPAMKGIEHFAFHLGGPTELMAAGTRFIERGYQSFWGPGRHIFGSNWFWYFNSPLSCHVEYDADMDLHDDTWVAREAPISADTSQLFLLQHQEKWVPGGGPRHD